MMIRTFTFLAFIVLSSTGFSQAHNQKSEQIYETFKSYIADRALIPEDFLEAHQRQVMFYMRMRVKLSVLMAASFHI